MRKSTENPLGKASIAPRYPAPEVLYAVPRASTRAALGLPAALPFHGEDLWNAWELSWLEPNGRPIVATGEFRIPAASPNLIESKSLKLYLNSLTFSRYPAAAAVRELIARDLSGCAGCAVDVTLTTDTAATRHAVTDLPGSCIDAEASQFTAASVDANLLRTVQGPEVSESLHSHLLRSLCPVTRQPDTGSILISYRGPKIDRCTLLEYLVSFRDHQGFHEACVERIFVDLKRRCEPAQLTVYARYNRRGGLDINPFRSDFETAPPNTRLWRQ